MSPTPSDASGRAPVSGSGRLPAVSGVRPGSELPRPGAPLFSEAQPSSLNRKAPRWSLPSPEARRCETGWTWQTRGAPPSPAEPRPRGWSRARGPLRPPAASRTRPGSRGRPGARGQEQGSRRRPEGSRSLPGGQRGSPGARSSRLGSARRPGARGRRTYSGR